MFLRQITDSSLAQNAYIIGCQRTGEAIIIDPERDVDRYLKVISENNLRLTAVAETHIHADYLSGARELMEHHGAKAYVSAEGGIDWQFEWAKGKPNAVLLHEGDIFRIGNIEFKTVLTAGHTPEHVSFLVTDLGGGANEPMAMLSGDFIFVGDVGRPDLLESAAGQAGAMEPSARTLYASLRATHSLPEHLQILPAHGAGSACGKALGAVPFSVLGYERRFNGALRHAIEGSEDHFVQEILSGQPEPPLYFARMKRDNKVGPVLLPNGELPQPRKLQASEISEWVTGGKYTILDLRDSRSEFMKRHLTGSLFTPMVGGNLPIAAGSYVAENSSIVLLLKNEDQLEEAVRQLVRIGLDDIVGWILVGDALAIEGITSQQKVITTKELANITDPVVLDVRSAAEFAASHVKGAKNIAHTRLAARLGDVPIGSPAHPLYVHCGSGLRASLAVPFLIRQKYDVIHVDGPFDDIDQSILE